MFPTFLAWLGPGFDRSRRTAVNPAHVVYLYEESRVIRGNSGHTHGVVLELSIPTQMSERDDPEDHPTPMSLFIASATLDKVNAELAGLQRVGDPHVSG